MSSKKITKVSIAEKLITYRGEMSRRRFASELKVSDALISKYEKGSEPGLDFLFRLQEHSGVSIHEWVTGDSADIVASSLKIKRLKKEKSNLAGRFSDLLKDIESLDKSDQRAVVRMVRGLKTG